MRSFSKKLAFVLAAAMVVTAFAPAAKAEAAKEMAINKSSQILYVNEGINHKGGEVAAPGKGNVSVYDFSVKNKPADWKTAYSFAWSSSDEDVVSVAKGGVATAVGVGKATVYCKVTEKATKEVTTLKTKVTVKANAYEVEITNADKWDGATVEVNGVVDLNRAMYDEDGNKTTKRGTLVTDYTKWVAEPAAGVEIDQKTGKFTFTEAAVAGEYKLSCYTYQSSKYTEKTAESDVVMVEFVKADKFEVDQTASNGFNLVFGKAADLKIADITVEKLIAVGSTTGKIPMVVSGVTMSEDKKTAAVSVFSNFENGATYEISVKGYEESATLVAFIGKPVSMTIGSKSGIQNGTLVRVNTYTELTYNLFDEQGNDVTNTLSNYNAFFKAPYNVNDYFVSGNTLYIYKAGTQATVEAEFHTADTKLTATAYFVGVDEDAVSIKSAALDITRSWGASYTTKTVPVNDGDAYIKFEVQTDAWNDYYAKRYDKGTTDKPVIGYLGYDHWIEFRASNPDVADVRWITPYVWSDAAGTYVPEVDGEGNPVYQPVLKVFKEGTTALIADLVTFNSDGSKNVNSLTSIYVNVAANRAYSKIEHFNTNGHLTVGNEPGFSTEDIVILAKDQYGDTLEMSNAEFTFADGNALPAGAVTHSYREGWKNYFTVDGSKFDLGTATAKQFYIHVKANVNDFYGSEINFSFMVTVRAKGSGATTLSLQAWNNMPNGDNVGRYVTPYDGNGNTEAAKSTTFKVFEMNNGIKVGQVSVSPKTSIDVDAALAEAFAEANDATLYFYTVERAGVELTNRDDNIVSLADNGKDVVLNFSQTASATMYHNFDYATGSAVNAVVYRTDDWKDVGAGTYIFTLYKIENKNKTDVYTQVGVTSTSSTLNTESYSFVKRTSEYAKFANEWFDGKFETTYGLESPHNQFVLRNCFEINGRDGQKTDNPYFVKAVESPNYVFVESITFFEALGGGEYATYTVNINVSLKK